jgi:hypothetical protein
MLSTLTDQHATRRFDLLDQIAAFHAISNSAMRRTAGMSPLVRS